MGVLMIDGQGVMLSYPMGFSESLFELFIENIVR